MGLWLELIASDQSLTVLSPTANHSFKKIEFQPPEAKKFFSTVRKEMALLATSLPDGIMVKTFEDRMVSGQMGSWGCGYRPHGATAPTFPCFQAWWLSHLRYQHGALLGPRWSIL